MMGASESKDVAKTESTFSNEEKVNIEKFYHKHFHSKESYMVHMSYVSIYMSLYVCFLMLSGLP